VNAQVAGRGVERACLVGEPFVHSLRVRYAECDAQGVVFNSHYLAFADIGMTEMWRAAFGSYQAMLDRGVDIVVADAQLRFLSPARFDDELTIEVEVARLGNTSVLTNHRVSRDGEPLAEVAIRHVFVELGTGNKTAIPDWARDGLARWVVPG
jgi:acyl-CoA thioester hydrolase